MKTTKIACVFLAYLLLLLAEGCDAYGSDCPDTLPYFDYRQLTVETNDPNSNQFFRIELRPDSVVFVAQEMPRRLNLLPAAYGCDCDYDGSQGDKYRPVAIDITADRPFNDTLPAGVSLRALFYGLTQGDIITNLSASFRPDPFYAPESTYSIATDARPQYLGAPYRFTLQWVKSNGDTLMVQTGEVVFN